MIAQCLWDSRLAGPADAVSWMGAVQSQAFPIARWSVVQRCRSAGVAPFDEAYARGDILRTHVLRPTWHFVSPADIRWMLALTGSRVAAKIAGVDARLGLDARLFARSNDVIAAAVEGGHRTRQELGEALAAAKIDASGQRLNHIVMRAELDAVICSGAPRGAKQTYATFDARAAKTKPPDDPAAELALRYFTSHGPATVKDFAWWSGMTVTAIRAAIGSLGSRLTRDEIDGREFWSGPMRRARVPDGERFDLVQLYDEIGVAYTESRDVLGSGRIELFSGVQLANLLLLNGRHVGTWRAGSKAGDEVSIAGLPAKRRRDPALLDAIERYRRAMQG